MSTSSRSLVGGLSAPDASFGGEESRTPAQAQEFGGGRDLRGQEASGGGGPGSSRKKRRRQRSQRNKGRRGGSGGGGGGGGGRSPHIDLVSRESMFQDIEGLLRQIRERAEETAEWTEAQLTEFVHAVTGFTKSLEEETEQVSERARTEYHRVREKLSQALRG